MAGAPLQHRQTGLPLESHLAEITQTLERTDLVLVAEPGAGKSSLVPLAAAASTRDRVVLLQPRRLAARATAERLASLLGERIGGESVGLTMRGVHEVSKTCRIEVVTEAILTQRLHADPELPGVGLVIFDEFHERNLHADLGLAMAIEVQRTIRPDLRVVVMSATIDPAPISELLDRSSVLEVAGRTYPVETKFLQRPRRKDFASAVAATIDRALGEHQGDVLAFVPGRGEIQRVNRELQQLNVGGRFDVQVISLTGGAQGTTDLYKQSPKRRVFVSTAVAETSITVPGVRIVVDGGLMRVPSFDASGFGELRTAHVTAFSADQRKGRAGRVSEGCCYRLWSEEDHRHLAKSTAPEISGGDPVEVAFELCRWGDPDGSSLPLLSPPPAHRLSAGRAVLEQLGLINTKGALTTLGQAANNLPVSPRMAAMLMSAEPEERAVAIKVAAFFDGGQDAGSTGTSSTDLATAIKRADTNRAEKRIKRALDRLDRMHHSDTTPWPSPASSPELGPFLARVWPDRIGHQRPQRPGAVQLVSGGEVELGESDEHRRADFLLVADAGGLAERLRVRLAAPLTRAEVIEAAGHLISWDHQVAWDDQAGTVRSTRHQRLGSLVLHTEPGPAPDRPQFLQALRLGLERRSLDLLQWSEGARILRERLVWLHAQDPAVWPDVSSKTLIRRLAEWFPGSSVRDTVEAKHLMAILPWELHQQLDVQAPAAMATATGRTKAIDYSSGRPVWSVRIQDVFGLHTHPVVGPNSEPLTIELLTPANRPAQVTADLPGFWRGSYSAVRTELRGRYPKHHWPTPAEVLEQD